MKFDPDHFATWFVDFHILDVLLIMTNHTIAIYAYHEYAHMILLSFWYSPLSSHSIRRMKSANAIYYYYNNHVTLQLILLILMLTILYTYKVMNSRNNGFLFWHTYHNHGILIHYPNPNLSPSLPLTVTITAIHPYCSNPDSVKVAKTSCIFN